VGARKKKGEIGCSSETGRWSSTSLSPHRVSHGPSGPKIKPRPIHYCLHWPKLNHSFVISPERKNSFFFDRNLCRNLTILRFH
jgi:hypothetical protein